MTSNNQYEHAMKNLILIILCIISLKVSSKSWSVSNITATANFSKLVDANGQAQAGDTIYVEGSGTPYEGTSITKKLVLIGPGYLLTENPNTHFNKKPALIKNNVIFEKGSLGSEIIGFDLKTFGANIVLKDNKITIRRNRLNYIQFYHKDSSITFDDIYITQNYIGGQIEEWRIGYDPMILNRLVVSNNYIESVRLGPNDNESSMSGLFENNVINDLCQCFNSTIRNNIFIRTNGDYYAFYKTRFNTIYNNVFTYNLPTDLTNYQVGTNNKWLVNKSTIFSGLTNNSTDGQWQLLTNSPAKTIGSDGSDCGMFGGATPYQLSGLPPVPVIYDIIGPDLQTGKVTVKARAIK